MLNTELVTEFSQRTAEERIRKGMHGLQLYFIVSCLNKDLKKIKI